MQSILCDFKECPLCKDGKWCTQSVVVLKNGACRNIYAVQNGQIAPRVPQKFDRERVDITIYNIGKAEDKNESVSN